MQLLKSAGSAEQILLLRSELSILITLKMLKFLSVAAPLACLFAPVYAHAGQCVDLTIPVTVTSENLVPAYAPFENNYESQYFFNLVTQRNGNISALYSGKVNITKTFSISAQYCTPSKKSRKSSTVQLLTHGLGFEKRLSTDQHLTPRC